MGLFEAEIVFVRFAQLLDLPQSGKHLGWFLKKLRFQSCFYLAGDFADLVGVVLRLVDGAHFEHALVLDEFLRVFRVVFDQSFGQE